MLVATTSLLEREKHVNVETTARGSVRLCSGATFDLIISWRYGYYNSFKNIDDE